MDDGINDTSTGDVNRRRRPIPVPLYDDRYIERPTLRKVELARIRDNLDELVDIKKTELFKDDDKKEDITNNSTVNSPKITNIPIITSIPLPEKTKPDTVKSEISEIKKDDIKKDDIKKDDIKKDDIKKDDIKKDDIKIGLSNLAYNKEKDKIDVIDNKKIDDKKIENKLKNIKVKRMTDEEVYNVSPEIRRQLRKAEIKEFHEEDETNKAVRKTVDLVEQNRRDLEDLKQKLKEENIQIKNELKNEFGNKFNDLTGKFESVNGKFDGVSKKLEETCTGIDCLKNDLAKLNKNVDLAECPECNQKVVPPLASYCPNCSAKMFSWEDDDGKPIKGWRPTWER